MCSVLSLYPHFFYRGLLSDLVSSDSLLRDFLRGWRRSEGAARGAELRWTSSLPRSIT